MNWLKENWYKENFYLDRFLAFLGGVLLIAGIVLLFIKWQLGILLIFAWGILPLVRNKIIKRF